MGDTMENKVCWIDAVNERDADASLSKIYQQVRSPGGHLDNLYQGFSLRPHTILPADDLYLAAMHHADNELPKQFSELIGTYVAILGGCEYAAAHHGHNFAHLIGNNSRSERVLSALSNDELEICGDRKEVSALHYVRKLCVNPAGMSEDDVRTLSETGWSDGEILEIVQVVAMFSYFIRVINGVGIQLGDEKLGLY